MTILLVHEHPDGSYTVKDARGHVMHSDVPGAIDFNAHGSVAQEHADDAIDVGGDDTGPGYDSLCSRIYRRRGRRPGGNARGGRRARGPSAENG